MIIFFISCVVIALLCLASSVILIDFYLVASEVKVVWRPNTRKVQFIGFKLWFFIGLILLFITILVFYYFKFNKNSQLLESVQKNKINSVYQYPLVIFQLGDEAFIGFLSLFATIIGFAYIYYQLRITRFDSKSAMLDRIHDYSERIFLASQDYKDNPGSLYHRDIVLSKIRFFLQLLEEFNKASKLGGHDIYNLIVIIEAARLVEIFEADITTYYE